MTAPCLTVKSLVKDYPRADGATLRLYGGLSFQVDTGQFVSVLGGSGWGKSTLVSIILGLERPTSGSVHYKGDDVGKLGFSRMVGRSKVAAVFQKPSLVPELSVRQNLTLALSMSRVPKAERGERIDEAVHFFGLETITDSFPNRLSAGQKRRAELARALAVRPDFLVLDEPITDLDTSVTNLALPLLKGMNRHHGTSILMTTAVPRVASITSHVVHVPVPSIIQENRIVQRLEG